MQNLTAEELEVVREYAREHGRYWKEALRDEWMRASGIGITHHLRNTHGPTWLHRFRLSKANASK